MKLDMTPPEEGSVADSELLARCHAGDEAAYGELFRSYHTYAIKIALANTCPSDVSDVAAEAFTRIFSAIRSGHGPKTDFKSYLASAVRNISRSSHQRSTIVPQVPVEPEVLTSLSPAGEDLPGLTAMAASDRALLTEVFASLPERWRTALWTTVVEEKSVAHLAEMLGISPNAASALCVRARTGIRAAWLKATASDPERQRVAR